MKLDRPEEIVVEVCTGSLSGARVAEAAGADRIELNAALELDGLTPSAGLLELVSSSIRIPIIAMARPRSGDFCYSPEEWLTLKSDAVWLLNHGADGIAFGCLTADGDVDLDRCREVRTLAGDHELVFHKAFDEVPHWENGLDRLIEAGINRVMTSGQKPTAMEGLRTIGGIVKRAAGRIEVLPAGRVSSKNSVEIVQRTGCNQLHGSFSSGPKSDIELEIRTSIQRLSARHSGPGPTSQSPVKA